MGRIYEKAKKRRAKLPFLSSVVPVSIILASTMQLVANYIIVLTPDYDFQDYWCGAYGLQIPLVYMLITLWVLLLIYLIVDAVRVVFEARRLKGSFLVIFLTLFVLLAGEIYAYANVLENVYVNDCEPHTEETKPVYWSRYNDLKYDLFVHEYLSRLEPNGQPLCPSGPPMGRWCRNSRLPEEEFQQLGRNIFGQDWHPGVKMEWRDMRYAIECYIEHYRCPPH